MLKAINISKSIGGKEILSEIDITINHGEILGLIGPSGGGKSTLLRTLSLLEKPDQGRIIVDEKTFDFPMKQFREKVHPLISVVFQQFHLWPHLHVRDNLLMPLREQRIPCDEAVFCELVNYFEIDNLLHRFPHQLSVGQKQRVAFVRAVLLKPKYLLLDEVTSALDVQHVGKMLRYIKKLAENGVGILVATHLIGFAANIADCVVFLNAGKIVESGDKTILKSPKTDLLLKFLHYSEYVG